MADVWVLILIAGFFGVCVALVRGCDSIIGADNIDNIDNIDDVDDGERDAVPR